MVTIAIRHTVADYDTWREVYDAGEDLRSSHGVTAKRVWRDQDDANEVFVTHDFGSLDDAKGFMDDPALGDAMVKSGVVGAPRIEIYQDA